MFGLGTILNTLAVVAGSVVGIVARKGFKQRFQDILMSACGVAIIFIGAAGTLTGMLKIENSTSIAKGGMLSVESILSTKGSMLLIGSLVLGGLLGEWIDIEKRMDALGEKLKKLFHAEKDNHFVEGFVNTSLVICVGAMAIVGSIEDGLTGDYSMLAVKAVLDFVIVVVFAASYGIGTACSAIAIFVYQGLITLAAHLIGNFVPDSLISDLSYVGSCLIFCVGINLTFGKKIKVGNLLPALLGPVVYAVFQAL